MPARQPGPSCILKAAASLSLGANLVLLVLAGRWLMRGAPAAPAPAVRVYSPPARRPASALTAGGRLTAEAVAALERCGLSRDAIVDALQEDLDRRWDRRFAELRRRYGAKPVPPRESAALSRQRDAERILELKTALGADGYRAWDKEQTLHALNGARPPGDDLAMTGAEAEQAYELQKAYDEKSQELQSAVEDGIADPADVGALRAQAQAALNQSLENLLGQERYDALRGIVDPVTQVSQTYGDLNPTPEQASAVLQAQAEYRAQQSALAAQLNANPADTAAVMGQLSALSDAQDDRLGQIFGADAYALTKRRNDPAYQTLVQYAGAWDLGDPELQSAYQTLHAFQEQADTLRAAADLDEAAGQQVDWTIIDAQIAQARQQAGAALQGALGEARALRLENNGLLPAP